MLESSKTTRINLPLDEKDWKALVALADADCRTLHDQLRFFIREEALRRNRSQAKQSNEASYSVVDTSEEANNG